MEKKGGRGVIWGKKELCADRIISYNPILPGIQIGGEKEERGKKGEHSSHVNVAHYIEKGKGKPRRSYQDFLLTIQFAAGPKGERKKRREKKPRKKCAVSTGSRCLPGRRKGRKVLGGKNPKLFSCFLFLAQKKRKRGKKR